mgnify:CR=1 FL=1
MKLVSVPDFHQNNGVQRCNQGLLRVHCVFVLSIKGQREDTM